MNNNPPTPKYKSHHIGERATWEFGDGEGGSGFIVKREPYKYWAECEVTGEIVEVDLRRHR